MKTSYSLYDILERVGKRPQVYVGERRLKNIGLFLDGYWIAMHDAGVEDTPFWIIPQGFRLARRLELENPYAFTSLLSSEHELGTKFM